jgi:hypothetical protein
MALRWEKQKPVAAGHSPSWFAYSGKLMLGMVVQVAAGPSKGVWTYSLSAVHTKWIAKGHGDVKSAATGKRAIERAWAAWLERANLGPRNGPTGINMED